MLLAGADDFLPVLIYVVIHANPPQLASNLEYIQRFRMHSRMVSESAYFFTQLVGLHLLIPACISCPQLASACCPYMHHLEQGLSALFCQIVNVMLLLAASYSTVASV